MPQPTPSDVHVNVPLTQISIAYMQDLANFAADRAAPSIPVDKQSDRYYTYDRADWNRDTAQERAPSTESAGGGWTVDNTPTYFAKVYALHKDIDDQLRANADPQLNLDRDSSQYVTRQLVLKKEKIWTSKFFTTGVWTTEITGVASAPVSPQVLRWNKAGSTPIEDVDAQRLAMGELTGFKPNRMAISPHVFTALKNHASILDRIKYTQRGVITLDLIAAMFDLDEVVVPWGIENTAAKGQAESNSFLYGKSALLYYVPPSPSQLIPSAMYTFSWTGYLGAGAMGNRILSFRMPHLKSDRIEGEMGFDMKLVGADLGVFFKTIVD